MVCTGIQKTILWCLWMTEYEVIRESINPNRGVCGQFGAFFWMTFVMLMKFIFFDVFVNYSFFLSVQWNGFFVTTRKWIDLPLYILERHLIGLKKNNSQAVQNWSKSVPMVFLWQLLRWFLVTSIPDKLRFLHPPAAFN